MESVFKFSTSRMALLAAFGLAVSFTPAAAADLGGDCCADLEERVAELEATTARKGNRKVSLTVSGWVNEAVFWWDDGIESNVYIGTNSLEQTRVRFTGEAKIVDGWSAGYTLELGTVGAASNSWDQDNPDGTNPNSVIVRKSNWWIKSKDYGKVTVGREGTATYHLLDDADGANTRYYSDAEAAAVAQGAFFLVFDGAQQSLRWSDVLRGVNNGTVGQNGRRMIVRYDTPEFWGFVATASWGEDDQGGVSLTYKNSFHFDSFHEFKIIAKGGWEQSTDEFLTGCAPFSGSGAPPQENCEWWGGAATIMHVETGLYVYGGFGRLIDHSVKDISPTADDTSDMWFVQTGIEQKWCSLGKTTVFGEYRHDDAGSKTSKSFTTDGVTGYYQDGDFTFWAGGVVQNIDAAAMDLYVIYRHADGDITNSAGGRANLEAFDMIISGGRIQF